MTIEKKLLGTSPSGGAANVAEVFSTFLYKGTGGALTVNNGIDLAGEGGLTWIKSRSNAYDNVLINSESGITKSLFSNDTGAEDTNAPYITSYNSNGFTLAGGGWYGTNETNFTYASWTFRKKEKFFTCLTYTGNGVAGREIPHGLAGPVGMLVVKCTSNAQSWPVWQKSIPTCVTYLNTTSGSACGTGNGVFGNAAYTNINPTDSVFTVGADNEVNGSSRTYVAYLFADNSSELADNQMIKCGSYNTSGSGTGSVDLGWQPQLIMMRRSDGGSGMFMYDTMRGLEVAGRTSARLYANNNSVEYAGTANINITATGFNDAGNVANNANVVYMAIRAPMMKEPEAATNVFAVAAADSTIPQHNSSFPVDMAMKRNVSVSDGVSIGARVLGDKRMITATTAAETTNANNTWDFMDGWSKQASANSAVYSWMWKRAKGFFDVVAYTGTGANHTVSHNLGAVPEMMWIKNRLRTRSWMVYHKDTGASKYLKLEVNAAVITAGTTVFQQLTPTDTNFYVGSTGNTNRYGDGMIAYLFGSLDGISKCGSYTGTGNNINVDCGFSAGARLILIKRTDSGHNWYLYDSVRGIVAGGDPYLRLDDDEAQDNYNDGVDPLSSGFTVPSGSILNVSSGNYIFYAIA